MQQISLVGVTLTAEENGMPSTHTLTGHMIRNEISTLRRLHGMLEHDQVSSREEFRDMMTAAFMHGRLELRELADDLGFSFSTVFRWVEGRSAPHPSLWPRIVEWVMRALDRKIASMEAKISKTAANELA